MSAFRAVPVAVLAVSLMALPIRAQAQPDAAGDPASRRVVTVFQNGLGQVWERRAIPPAGGPRKLILEGVSRRALTESLRLAGEGGELSVHEIQLERELLTPATLLERHLGKEIGVIKRHPTTGEETVHSATVVSLAGGVVLRMDGRLVTGMPNRLAFPDDTMGLPARPRLTARVSGGDAVGAVTLTYLTEGLDWSVDYTATLAPGGKALRLEGWARVGNDTGVAMDAGRLRLVAGQVNRAAPPRPMAKAQSMTAAAEGRMAADTAQPLPQRDARGAVHVYTLDRPVALAPGDTKQVALLAADDVPVAETLISTGHPPVFGPARGEPRPEHPDVRLEFLNGSLAAGGLPLPGGTVRVYRGGDTDPAPLFAGADRIPDTPDGERVELTLGQAFDVTVTRQQTEYKRLDPKGRDAEAAFRITARNARDEPVRLRIDEALPGDWRMVEETAAHERVGGQARWTVTVPAGGEDVLAYRVKVLR